MPDSAESYITGGVNTMPKLKRFCFIEGPDGPWYMIPEDQRDKFLKLADCFYGDCEPFKEAFREHEIGSPNQYSFCFPKDHTFERDGTTTGIHCLEKGETECNQEEEDLE